MFRDAQAAETLKRIAYLLCNAQMPSSRPER
jgi:hypothetical protein